MKSLLVMGSVLLFTQIAIADNSFETDMDEIESKVRHVLQTQKKENEVISIFVKKGHKYVRLISSNPDLEGLYLNHQINKQLKQHGAVMLDDLKAGKYKCDNGFIKAYNHGEFAIAKGYNCSKAP